MQRPSDIRPQIGVVDTAVVDRFQNRQLSAKQPPQIAPLAETVIGHGSCLCAQTPRFFSLQFRERLRAGPIFPRHEQIAGSVIRFGIDHFTGEVDFIVNGTRFYGSAKSEIALAVEQFADRGFPLDVDPLDSQLDAQLAGKSLAKFKVEPRTVLLRLE